MNLTYIKKTQKIPLASLSNVIFKLKDTISDWGISVSSTFLVNVKFYFPLTFIYFVESTSV